MEVRLRHGAFRGQLLDTRTRRSLALVSEDAGAFVVDHFLHRGQLHRARIPKGSVVRIHGQRIHFGAGYPLVGRLLYHAQARFVLDPAHPVELLDGARPDSPVAHRIEDFCYSVEVVGPRGRAWSLRHAFGDFVSAHRFLSTEEVVFERVLLAGQCVEQSPPLRMHPEQMARGLELIVRRSARAGLEQRYYLLTARLGARNCTSAVFDALDRVLIDSYAPRQRAVAALLWRLPLALRRYLALRDVIDPEARMPTLNDELAALAASDAMQERLRAHRAARSDDPPAARTPARRPT